MKLYHFYGVGVALGIIECFPAGANIATWVMTAAVGFDYSTAVLLLVACGLAVAAVRAPAVQARLALGDFHNAARWWSAKFTRAVGVMSGISTVALLYWACTGSRSALGTCLGMLFLCLVLAYCKWMLAELVKVLPTPHPSATA